MCDFYSCILDRKGKLYDDPTKTDSHEDLIEKFNLKDNKLKNRDIVRIEVNPDWDALKKKFNKKDWTYKVDEPSTIPDWYMKNEKKMEGIVWKRIQELYKTLFLFGGEYDELPFDLMILVKDARIKEMKNQKVLRMGGSSQVLRMRDSSQVGEMWGSSQVGEMWDSSQVRWMGGSSQVLRMRDSSLATTWSNNTKIKQEGKNTVVVDRSGDKVKVKI